MTIHQQSVGGRTIAYVGENLAEARRIARLVAEERDTIEQNVASTFNPILSAVSSFVDTEANNVNGAYLNRIGAAVPLANMRYAKAEIPIGATKVRISTRFEGSLAELQLISWYSDAGGVAYLSGLDGAPNTDYFAAVFDVPPGARSIGVNGRVALAIKIEVAEIAADLNDRVLANEASVGAIQSSLAGWIDSVAPTTENSYLNRYGVAVASAGLRFAKASIPAGVQKVRITTNFRGTLDLVQLITWYGDAAGTAFMGRVDGTSGADYLAAEFDIPLGAEVIGVDGHNTRAIKIEFLEVAQEVAPRLIDLEQLTAALPVIQGAVSSYADSGAAVVADAYLNRAGAVVAAATFRYAKAAIPAGASKVRISTRFEGSLAALQLISWYSDAGATAYLGRVDGAPNTTYANTIFDIPPGAQALGVDGKNSAPIRIEFLEVVDNLAEIVSNLSGTGLPTKLTIVGDSMSATGTAGFGDELGAELGLTTYQQGIGGKRSNAVSALFGGIPLTVTVTGASIPTAGEAAITPAAPLDDLNSRGGTDCVMLVMAAGYLCELRYYTAGGTYALRPVEHPRTAIPVVNPLTIMPLTGWVIGTNPAACVSMRTMFSDAIAVIRVGVNDQGYTLRPYAQTTIANIMTLHDNLQRYTDKILVVGPCNGAVDLTAAEGGITAGGAPSTLTPEQSEIKLANIDSQRSGLSRLCPAYFDALAFHAGNGGGETKSANGRSFVVLTQTAASPKLSDGRHETVAAQQELAAGVHAYLKSIGWVK
ncbi:hypothetical protein GRI97_08060 [Altererythrobacter xixiisoli]|uniref:Uncharacterized protein n=1 Tax=Croceibacterium xixiisoli TaxID=1476466 RepID=A0A6I4TUN8_9SPHN|nr:hypothetical protein [Croceibacterium xixiisoli]MXO98940.1 hypothetical protein [Croceibacterium xixiisoli]